MNRSPKSISNVLVFIYASINTIHLPESHETFLWNENLKIILIATNQTFLAERSN